MPSSNCGRSIKPDCIRTFDSIDKNLEIIRIGFQNHLKHHEMREIEESRKDKWVKWIIPIILSVINLIMILKIRIGG